MTMFVDRVATTDGVPDHLKPAKWSRPDEGMCRWSGHFADMDSTDHHGHCPGCGAPLTCNNAANEAAKWPPHRPKVDPEPERIDRLLASIGEDRVRSWLAREAG